jgi:hypothetical protein
LQAAWDNLRAHGSGDGGGGRDGLEALDCKTVLVLTDADCDPTGRANPFQWYVHTYVHTYTPFQHIYTPTHTQQHIHTNTCADTYIHTLLTTTTTTTTITTTTSASPFPSSSSFNSTFAPSPLLSLSPSAFFFVVFFFFFVVIFFFSPTFFFSPPLLVCVMRLLSHRNTQALGSHPHDKRGVLEFKGERNEFSVRVLFSPFFLLFANLHIHLVTPVVGFQ